MNWPKIIADIEAQGLSLTKIGQDVHAPVSTLSDLKQGRSREPRGALAISLMALHGRLCAASAELAQQQEVA